MNIETYKDLVGDYADNCRSTTLMVWRVLIKERQVERLRVMDHRKEYISDEDFKVILIDALKLRNNERDDW